MDMYEQLRDVLDSHPTTAPKSKAIIEILKILFTPDEAAVALAMSFKAGSIGKIAAAASLPEPETEKRLEAMANKGILFSKSKDGKKIYGLVPLIPGVFEFPFMKSDGSPMYQRLGRLWEEYHHEALGASFAGNPTPLMRVVAVEKSLKAENRVHPYEEVKHFINSANFIALADCACRTSVGKCDKPKDVCLIFEGAGEFLVERGFARHITREEGMRVLDRSEEAGLVHTSNNSAEKANLICNCCPCCCTVLRGKTQIKHPHAFEPSRFEARVSGADCTGCGVCADERCPVKAIEMKEGIAVANAVECIGCGLCVTGCPTEAIYLAERKSIPAIPATITEMGVRIAQEKGRFDKFIKIMQR
ncbi:MAG TPA: 4Fe-4S dicluster domain-containing protein [Spirochaetota bacterium]|nr:4Fe-4S dicluster domain-containing protein [Spirochaetota bacterium]